MSQGATEGNALSKQRSKSSKKKQNPGDRASNPGREDDPQNKSIRLIPVMLNAIMSFEFKT